MLGVRLDLETEQRLALLAKRQKRSKSDIARELIVKHVRAQDQAFLAEARRQSINASRGDNIADYEFWESVSAWNDDRE